jgi:type IV pilus assembly protein PilY1
VVDVATGRVLSKTSTGVGDTTTPSGFAKITAVTNNPLTDPLVTYVYGGDNQGKMWRFDFTTPGSPTVVQMGDAGTAQPVTSRPEVTMCRVEHRQEGVTTSGARGRDLRHRAPARPARHRNTDIQSVYVLKDSGSAITPTQWRNAVNMSMQKLTLATARPAPHLHDQRSGDEPGTQAGWYFDLDQNTGERVNLDPKVVAGTLNVVSNMPDLVLDCSVGGSSNLYQLNVCTGEQVVIEQRSARWPVRTLSGNAAAVGFIIVRLPNGTLKLVATTADGGTVSCSCRRATDVEPTAPAGAACASKGRYMA